MISTRGQSLHPISYLIPCVFLILGVILFTLYTSHQTRIHTQTLIQATTPLGATRTLAGILEYSINGTRIIDLVRNDDPLAQDTIRMYIQQYAAHVNDYAIYVDDELIAKSSDKVTNPKRARIVLTDMTITAEFNT